MFARRALAALALVALIAPEGLATDVFGSISADTTWTAAASPYRLTASVVVQPGATLTIEPGVEVRAIAGATLTVDGALHAVGAAATPIVLRADAASPSPGAWTGLQLNAGSSATLAHVAIHHASTALAVHQPTTSQHTLSDLTLRDYSVRGVHLIGNAIGQAQTLDRLDATSSTAAARPVTTTRVALTLRESRLRGGIVGVDATNASVALDRVVIADAQNDGVALVATVSGSYVLDVQRGTFIGNTYAMRVQRSSSSSYQISVDVRRSIFADNAAILRDSASASYKSSFVRFNENVHVGTLLSGANAPSTQTGNLPYDPLLADPVAGDYAPTERSPARWFAPGDPTATVGALPYTGTPSPPGVHGVWYVDKTFAADSVTEVAGDLLIAAGAKLTFLPGAELRIATTDAMRGGRDTSRVEIQVFGILEADGTNSKPVRFTSAAATPTPGDWYGVIIGATTQAFNVSQVDLGYARRGVTLESNSHIVAGSTIHHCSEAGVWVDQGSPTLEKLVLSHNHRGVYSTRATDLSLVEVDVRHSATWAAVFANSQVDWAIGRLHDNASGGIDIDATVSGTYWARLANLTIAHNGGPAIETLRSSSSSYQQNIELVDSSLTHNAGAALRDIASASYRTTIYCYASNLWGNSGQFSGAQLSGTPTCFAENPLYLDADARAYAPTTHSPNRHLGRDGGLVGAVSYTGVTGPHLMGWMWEDYAFTRSGSPWPILGDITVPSGVTVTFEPGARLEIVPGTDGMAGGVDTSRVEVRALQGATLHFDGSGDPIVLTPATDEPEPGDWYGLRFQDAGASVVDNARVHYPRYGAWIEGPSAPAIVDSRFVHHDIAGIWATSVTGTPGLDVLAAWVIGDGGGHGVSLTNSNARVRSSYVTHHTTGVQSSRSSTGTSVLYLINNTLVHHDTGVLYSRSSSSSYQQTVYVENNVIAENRLHAIRDGGSTSYRTTDYVRNNHLWGAASTSASFNEFTANITTSDPLVEDDDWEAFPRWWDGKLWPESLSVNGGRPNATQLPDRDIAGHPRDLAGGVDIGAWEFDPDANREPRADAVADAIMVPRGEVFTLDGAAAFDPDGFIASAWWTMSDGTVTAGQTVTHTFANAGHTQWAYLTIIDDEGAEDHALVNVNVNIRPIANAGPAVFQDEGPEEDVFFDGTLSTDPDGTLVSWAWDFGDGTPVAHEQSPRHSYLSAGLYTVTLTVTDNEGLTDSDTTLATVYGVTDTVGPLVQHVEIADGVPVGTAVEVVADVRDPSGVANVVLQYRPIGATVASFVAMTPSTGHLWTATIPASAVTSAGVEYWFIAVDGHTDANTSTTPAGAPGTDVFDFLVVGDPDPPVIAHTPIANGQTPGAAVTVSATITDATGVAGANLYFRPTGGTSFGAAPMVNIAGDTWTAQIPAFIVASPGVAYYLEATDTSPLPNTGYAPAGAPATVHTFTVASSDTTPPIIAHTPVDDGRPAGAAVAIVASAADNEGVASVTLHYRPTGAATFTSVPLAKGAGTSWVGAVPGDAVTTAGVDYWLVAADAAGNTASSPADAPLSWHAFTVVDVDAAPPAITHTPIADGQPVGVSVPVSATITDPSGVASARVFYRPAGFPIFQEVTMSAAGDVYTASIPAFGVSAPSVAYYIRATDGLDNTGSHPAAGATTPHVFTVVDETADVTGPTIVHDPITAPQTAGDELALTAIVFDASGVASVTAYYRALGAVTWQSLTLDEQAPGEYAATLPTAAIAAPGVEYYLEAIDAAPGANATTHPAAGAGAPHAFAVVAPDVTPPVVSVTAVPNGQVAGVAVVVTATVTDDVGVASVTLHHRVQGSAGAYATVAMTAAGGDSFTATIPAGAVASPGVQYYVTAADAAGNTAYGPESAPATPLAFTVGTPDTTPPAVNVTAVPNGQVAGAAVVVSATVTDDVGIASVTLHHRLQGSAAAYATAAMSAAGGGSFTATIPAGDVALPGVQYYVTAADAAGNTAFGPETAPATPLSFTVTAADTAGPTIAHTPPAGPLVAGDALQVSATVTDPSGVADATLRWRTGTSGAYASIAMTRAGDVFSATVPTLGAPSVSYWIAATDDLANAATAPADAPTSVFTVAVVVPDLTGPAVAHEPVGAGQTPGAPVALVAQVQDPSGVASVHAFYRPTTGGSFASVALADGGGGVWSGVIPGAAVTAPGVAYYLRAVDGAPAANVTTSPADAPATLHTFTVGAPPADTTPPVIVHTPIAGAQVPGAALALSATVTDASGVAAVTVYFRPEGETTWLTAALTAGGGGVWTGAIPALAVTAPGLSYYLRATDGSPNANAATHPADAPTSVHAVSVVAPDVTGPVVTVDAPPAAVTAGTPIPVAATAVDPAGVAFVDLMVRHDDDVDWTDLPMVLGADDRWAVVIPAERVVEGQLSFYVLAEDGLGNTATGPVAGAAGPLMVTVEAAPVEDATPPVIVHSPATVVAFGAPVALNAIVTDASGVAEVVAYFREVDGGAFASVALASVGDDRFSGELPSFATRGVGVEYYLRAVDAAAAANVAFDPSGAPNDTHFVEVLGQIAEPGPSDASTGDTSDDVGGGDTSAPDTTGADTTGGDTTGDDVEVIGAEVDEQPQSRDSGGCTTSGAPTPALLLALLALGLALARRRRTHVD